MNKYNGLSSDQIETIMKCFCIDIDATKTAELLGYNRKTINRYYTIFRQAVAQHQIQEKNLSIDSISTDEFEVSYKHPILGMYEKDGHVYIEIIPDSIKKEVVRLIRGRVETDKIISMNDWRYYDVIIDYAHDKYIRINRKSEGNYVSGLESFWSFVKRRLSQFNGVHKNFELHLKECEWRYSNSTDELLVELKELVYK